MSNMPCNSSASWNAKPPKCRIRIFIFKFYCQRYCDIIQFNKQTIHNEVFILQNGDHNGTIIYNKFRD